MWQANLSEDKILKNTSYHYLISDHLGMTHLVRDSNGKQSWKIRSDALGHA
ncbi:hypothetical protein [Snodgrassella sp. ESL0253]|uniref:hypothetical protein n=1 Tax=Snodgrassella sp. ESL0253 TaxID=2705031 RepID=UPI001583325B|nr:hypothetical protein [Snodgrassella sp. ESL0253]NUE67702.1 hypothetical protein [Snodgrassella sp. ESL0253]